MSYPRLPTQKQYDAAAERLASLVRSRTRFGVPTELELTPGRPERCTLCLADVADCECPGFVRGTE